MDAILYCTGGIHFVFGKIVLFLARLFSVFGKTGNIFLNYK